MTENVSEILISDWVGVALENENIKNYKIEVTGTSEKGEGYATDVVFVKVSGSEKTSGKSTELNLVLKVGKDFKGAFDQDQMEEAYIREMYVYDKVFPQFKQFQLSKNHQNIFISGAKCIKTLNLKQKIIVFENLRTEGYEAFDRQQPMNIDHIKIVLKNYALLHAISFAHRDQRKSEFENLIKNYTCMYKIMTESTFRSMFQIGALKTYDAIKDVDENIANKYHKFIENGVVEILEELFDKIVEESVITHGDCWSSNFLFKYANGNKRSPSNVAILDWQVSSYTSPIIDVGYFLFIVSSKNEVAEFDNLLDYYYENLTRNISELGSDPNKLFPRSTFQEHWKIFSTIGFIFATSFLNMVLVDKNDAPAISDSDNVEDILEMTKNLKAKNTDMLVERVLSLSRYYFELHNI